MGCDQKNHGWKVRAETKAIEYLYGACLNIKLTIGNVFVDQNFFVRDKAFYPIILDQPFITAVRMEAKVLDKWSGAQMEVQFSSLVTIQ